MVLKMASPWRDPQSGIFYLKIRVPSDLLPAAKGRTIFLPIGAESVQAKIGEVVKVSLRTREPTVAKSWFTTALSALNDYWQAVRKGPQALSHRDAVALSGEIYRAFTSALEDDPGTYERWANVLEMNDQARAGDYGRGALMIGQAAKIKRSMEERFGPLTDALLRGKGLILDAVSRERVLAQVSKSLDQASAQLKRYADGDYSPDINKGRFPEFKDRRHEQSKILTLTSLFEAWEKQVMQLGRAKATPNRYRSVFANLRTFLGHDDASRVTPEDIIAFKDARLAEGISGRTIKDGDLAALKSVFGWAVENKRLRSNPASTIVVRVSKRKVEREVGFTDQEANQILTIALTYVRQGKESAHLAVAKKWVPWLCAFTGARVSEITALNKESFRVEGGVHTVRIFGSKTSEYRDVPLHPQLAAIGLTEFVTEAEPGPLFHGQKDQKGRGAESQSEKLAKWVRSVGITDPRVQPNHGWRHRFTTVARAVSMDHEKREYILGHALPGLGSVYGDMAGLYAEIIKLPLYTVEQERLDVPQPNVTH
jgi:integrase